MSAIIDGLGWLALAATCIAAIVTAANLGARATGYGFLVFFVGALAWCAVGAATGQRQLLWSNGFLALVDLFGVWRWLWRRARAEDAVARVATDGACVRDELFALDLLSGKPVMDTRGKRVATIEGALADCQSGALQFLVVRPQAMVGDVTPFKRLSWRHCTVAGDIVSTDLDAADIEQLPDS